MPELTVGQRIFYSMKNFEDINDGHTSNKSRTVKCLFCEKHITFANLRRHRNVCTGLLKHQRPCNGPFICKYSTTRDVRRKLTEFYPHSRYNNMHSWPVAFVKFIKNYVRCRDDKDAMNIGSFYKAFDSHDIEEHDWLDVPDMYTRNTSVFD